MGFHLGLAYGVAVLAVLALAYAGGSNQRSGWRKQQKANGVLDILMAWAQAKEENRQAWQPNPVQQPAMVQAVPDMEMQLSALAAALTMGSSPAPTEPAAQPEKTTADLQAKAAKV